MDKVKEQGAVHAFQAESVQLLDLMTNSLYSNKEIFLRELISNASDAIEKLKFLSLQEPNLLEEDFDLNVFITFDREGKTITVEDNGVGMTRSEIMKNLGTIAWSGTKEFVQSITQAKYADKSAIGNFGVGFYASFIVAKKIIVYSRKVGKAANEGVLWESTGGSTYSIKDLEKKERGTKITLYLKDTEGEFLNYWKLRSVVVKYSDHITVPILMQKEGSDSVKEVINNASALWTLPKTEITKQQYVDLYKNISNDYNDPLFWSHNIVEGGFRYISLLYIPSRSTQDIGTLDKIVGLKLYVRRVFIMSGVKTFLPNYLRFVCGIIDSDDLKVNVSREILQEDNLVRKIRLSLVNRILTLLEELSEKDNSKYLVFWENFGYILKEGVGEDFANKERVAKLLRFNVSVGEIILENISLKKYIENMVPKQTSIYYVTGETKNSVKNNPQIELFKCNNVPVLLLSDRIDEWLVVNLTEFLGYKLQSIVKEGVDYTLLKEINTVASCEDAEKFIKVLNRMKNILNDVVRDIRLTKRLVSAPSCIVLEEYDMSLQLTRIMTSAGQTVKKVKPILEINPKHEIVQYLLNKEDDNVFKIITIVLYEQALLAEGGQLADVGMFVKNMNDFIQHLLNK